MEEKYKNEEAEYIANLQKDWIECQRRFGSMTIIQACKIFRNYRLFHLVCSACNRIYANARTCIRSCGPTDYMLYIQELDAYIVCNKLELANLSKNLREETDAPKLRPYIRTDIHMDVDICRDYGTPEQRAIIADDDRKEREYNLERGYVKLPPPKATVFQIIRANEASQLVLQCDEPRYRVYIKDHILARYQKSSSFALISDTKLEITVDWNCANMKEGLDAYMSLHKSFPPPMNSIMQTLHPMGLCDSEPDIWRARIDLANGDIYSQLKTPRKEATTTSPTQRQPCNSKDIAIAWIIANPPAYNETRGKYRERYANAHESDRVSTQAFPELVMNAGYKSIVRGKDRFWGK